MNILFVCTHNACRSILAEAITRQLSNGRLSARSAGSEPTGRVHPLTFQQLARHNYCIEGLNSKSWGQAIEGCQPDIVITVCNHAAAETCPITLGNAVKGHWGLIDPTHLSDSSLSEDEAFDRVIKTIEARIQRLLAEPFEALDKTALQRLINQLGEITEGAV
jgi:arsenate reductase